MFPSTKMSPANTFISNDNLEIKREYKTTGKVAILFYSFIHSLLIFFETWSPSVDENLPFPIFFQKLFPPEVILNQKKSLKGILEKGVLCVPCILLKMTFYTGIYQRFCQDFKIFY